MAKSKNSTSSTLILAAITLLFIIGYAFFNSSDGEVQNNSAETGSGSYEVLKIIDGDTIKIDYNGEVETLRLIGIDTPELGGTNVETECFAEEAKSKLEELIGDRHITFEDDSSQGDADRYGRYLMYIFVDGDNLNQKMIELGYAYEYTYDTPYKYQEEFQTAEKNARNNKLGLWSADTCNGERLTISDN